MKFFLMTLGFFLTAVSSDAFEVGAVSISGHGCEKQNFALQKPADGQYQFPLKLILAKSASKALERKTCMLSLPLKLGPKEKLQISDVSQKVKAQASGQSKIKFSLAVTAVGVSASQPIEFEIKASGAQEKNLQKDGVLFETSCGKDVILRANLSVFAQGSGGASADTGDLKISMKTIPCP